MIEYEYSNKSDEELISMYKDAFSKYRELGEEYYKIQEDILHNRIELEKILMVAKQRNLNLE